MWSTAGEGGAWGMAILALYTKYGNKNISLPDFLDEHVFTKMESSTLNPDEEGLLGYEKFINRYKAGLPIELTAIQTLQK